ncbi:type IV pilus assembly protein PilQ [Selenomonas sp. GACV-9]|uniref:secretin N-terminal domain-containing protein n=1 Tax=Selenomonas sp. GACV-9 TaxID=3158782 RepID=UPI0008EA2518|nr:type IV pilus assembly protein PilQ [Selenomonas ruminantium]
MKRWQRCCLLTGLIFGVLAMPAAKAEPMQVQVTDGDVRAVLLSAARMGKLNLVLDDAVTGTVTLTLTDEPERVLRLVAAAKGLVVVRDGSEFIVTTAARAASLRSMHVYKVKYANPQDLAQIVNLSLQSAGKNESALNHNTDNTKKKEPKEKTADPLESLALANETTGAVVFYGTAAEAQAVEMLLHELDVPAEQVSLEAKVVALSRNASKELGVEWQWSKLPQYPESHRRWYHVGKDTERVETEVRRQWQDKEQVPGIIQFGHGPEGQPFEFYFAAKLNALITDGKAKILARPNITTLQGHEAVINIGGEVPVPTQSVTDATTTTTMTYRQAGIILRCTPRVNANRQITAEVHTEVSTPLFVNDIKAYRFQKRSADTNVRLQDGETMVIGGLIGSEESRSLSKIPVLGDIPILGQFFRNLKHSRTESEIMIFLTAHILGDSGGIRDTGQPEK